METGPDVDLELPVTREWKRKFRFPAHTISALATCHVRQGAR